MRYSKIRVLVARSIKAVDDSQCDDVRECDTIKEAKEFARYALSPEYQRSAEMSEPMNYARIMVFDGTSNLCLQDYFRKGWSPHSSCDDCGAVVKEIIGCPDGAEICQACFDAGGH